MFCYLLSVSETINVLSYFNVKSTLPKFVKLFAFPLIIMMSSMASLWIWALIISLLILVLYLIGTWSHDHFSKRNVPTLKTLPFIGNMGPIAFKQLSFPDFIADIYNRLKGHKYAGIYDFSKPVLLLRDPELIKMVTVKDFEYFLDHRIIITEDSEPTLGKGLFNLQGKPLFVFLFSFLYLLYFFPIPLF